MALRVIIVNGERYYCTNGDDIEKDWRDSVSDGIDKVVCCDLDSDYHVPEETCFKVSEIDRTESASRAPGRNEDDRPRPDLTFRGGPLVTINFSSKIT